MSKSTRKRAIKLTRTFFGDKCAIGERENGCDKCLLPCIFHEIMCKIVKKHYFYDWHKSENELPPETTIVVGWMWIGADPQIPFWVTALYDHATQKFYTYYENERREIDLIWWANIRKGKAKR